ncbi:phospho-sugar mutase [Thermospira aquatica]|uniref:Phospho-sugar mutase n=1 Tax=Thermospira aquatica TaxID=2828656 RepID=A0AAX3BEX1_9SPIR|nr:phospho-sugar mutase [Thermospira aquatica]URA10246.1 phospho-sugar mutase [Thermospira aquatica]
MNQNVQKRIQEWLGPEYDEETRAEIQNLIDAGNEKELEDRFYTELEFGTGGLRGIIGAGTNRMNRYVVRKATQGLANYIYAKGDPKKGIVIGRDSRIMSDVFAFETAAVMAANGIKVYFYEDIHPTPMVSFAIRELKAQAGVMITASHNPKEYNGYKVMWDDGCQVTPPADKGIIEEVRKITSLSQVKYLPFEEAKAQGLIEVIDTKIDALYLERVKTISIHPEVAPSSDVKICYSPLYGTGYKIIPAALKVWGFENVYVLPEQATPNGNFPTTPYPNPEETEAMARGINFASENNYDIFIATDPDADRLGVALRDRTGKMVLLNGNQIATLLAYYVATEKKLPPNPWMVKTIVTTDLIADITNEHKIGLTDVLTGFKWIGLKIREFENEGKNFVFGCEESHGVLLADFVRDKDAIMGVSLFAELTAYYKSKGTSALNVLYDIYRKYGFYKESQKSLTLSGVEGLSQIKAMMEKLRTNTPKNLGKWQVLEKQDMKTDEIIDMTTGQKKGRTGLPSSDVVVLKLSDGAKVVARPSGTEPKIKFYFTTRGRFDEMNTVEKEHEMLRQAFLLYIQG